MSEQYVVPMKIDSSNIRGRIYTIRGVQVLLDSDLAELYHVETRRINESVKRNPKRFPSGFCFELTQEEYELLSLKSHNATSNGRGGRRKLPKAFSEQGVAMLSAVLSSDYALEVSISIMNAFVTMRHYLADNAIVFQRLDRIELKQLEADEKFKQIFKQLDVPKQNKAIIFFKGQMWDATSCIEEIIGEAKKSISKPGKLLSFFELSACLTYSLRSIWWSRTTKDHPFSKHFSAYHERLDISGTLSIRRQL